MTNKTDSVVPKCLDLIWPDWFGFIYLVFSLSVTIYKEELHFFSILDLKKIHACTISPTELSCT